MKLTINGLTHDVDVDDEMPLLWELCDEMGLVGNRCGCSIRVRQAVQAAANLASRRRDEAGLS